MFRGAEQDNATCVFATSLEHNQFRAKKLSRHMYSSTSKFVKNKARLCSFLTFCPYKHCINLANPFFHSLAQKTEQYYTTQHSVYMQRKVQHW